MVLADLTPAARSRVRGGITADDAADADRILSALRVQRLPPCRTTGSTQPSPTTSSAPATETTAAPQPTDPTPGGSSPSPTTSARTTASPAPGVDCREAE
jgi:protein phosphatase